MQYADFRHPIFPGVPALAELGETAEAKGVFKLLVSVAKVGRGYAAPPGVPTQTVEILRKAFQDMVADSAFKADTQKRGADLLPMSGKELAAYISGIAQTSPDIVQKARELIAAQ